MSERTAVVDAFGECLDALLDGRPISECLDRHEPYRDQLEPLLAVVLAARDAEYVPTWTPERRAHARAAFLGLASGLSLKPVDRAATAKRPIRDTDDVGNTP